MYTGTVVSVKVDRGFGFVSQPGLPDVFFHAMDLAPELPFDVTLREMRVTFDVQDSAKGPRAVNVRPAD